MTWCKNRSINATGWAVSWNMHKDSWNWGEITEIHGRGDEAINSPSLIILAPQWGSMFPWHRYSCVFQSVFTLRGIKGGKYRIINWRWLTVNSLCFLLFSSLFIVGEVILCLCRQTHTYLPHCNCALINRVSSLWHDVHLHREDKKQMLLLSKLFEAFTTFS